MSGQSGRGQGGGSRLPVKLPSPASREVAGSGAEEQTEPTALCELAQYAIEVHGAVLASPPPSPGFIPLSANVNETKEGLLTHDEWMQRREFRRYRDRIGEQRVLVVNLEDPGVCKAVKRSDASRYFDGGRRRVKAKVYKRLGRWVNANGILLTLTFNHTDQTRAEAWESVGKLRREFMNAVNVHRRRAGMPKAKCMGVIEAQKNGYPHVHLVFPYLKYLARIDWLSAIWGQGPNAVDLKYRDSLSPVGYVTKYITKLSGWSDLALSYIWANKTRLYSMSRDYSLPDYSDKRVAEWCFWRQTTNQSIIRRFAAIMASIDTFFGVDDLMPEIIALQSEGECVLN